MMMQKDNIPLILKKTNNKNNRTNKINEEILASKIRLIDPISGINDIFILYEALKLAKLKETDLVQITDGEIPVCKLIDYDKFAFQQEKAKKKNIQHTKKLKQIKLHPNIAKNDLVHKTKQIREFILSGHQVQVICTFSGRENRYKEFGRDILNSIIEDLKNISKIENPLKEEGNNIKMTLMKI